MPESREEAQREVSSLLSSCEGDEFRILIGGPNNSGKSTFGRQLVNSLIDQGYFVAWLDCDVGQPEFTPPSVVSLHILKNKIQGTPLDHLQQPEIQYFVGSVSPKTETEYYIECILALLLKYEELAYTNKENKTLPLIINTNGWIKGNGGKILSKIVSEAKPNVAIQLLTESFISMNRNLVDFKVIVPDTHIITLESFSNDLQGETKQNQGKYQVSNNNVTSKQMRELLIMKYFQCDSMPLAKQAPYAVQWNKIRVRFLHDELPCSMAMLSLNSMIVGLCCDTTQYKPVGERIAAHQEFPNFLLSTPICECVGLGIIRAIDPIKHLFYVITPVNLQDLARVNTFVKGSVEIPTVALLDGGVTNPPYLCSNALSISDGSGAAPMDKKRPNIPRRRE